MTKRRFLTVALGAALTLASYLSPAAEQQEQIYGRELMTKQERVEYRNKVRAAKTEAEREQLRAEHHRMMVERARQRGVTLPAEMPARPGGMGPGAGMGPGMGTGMGAGKGPGGGR